MGLVYASYNAMPKEMSSKQRENKTPALELFGANFKLFSNIASFLSFPDIRTMGKRSSVCLYFVKNFMSAVLFKVLCNPCYLMAMSHFYLIFQ